MINVKSPQQQVFLKMINKEMHPLNTKVVFCMQMVHAKGSVITHAREL